MDDAIHWTVPLDHPAFAGHFPGTPILPGVLLLDTVLLKLAEASGLSLQSLSVSSVKFLSPAKPGDQLTLTHQVNANGSIRFQITAAVVKQSTKRSKANSLPEQRPIAGGTIVPRPTEKPEQMEEAEKTA